MTTSWTCPSCGRRQRRTFCADCGEERLRPGDLSLSDLAGRFVQTLSSVDGKLVRSSRAILGAPGTLTASYVRGERRRFLGPLQMFLIANALFFTVQSLTGMNVLSSTLDSHLNVQDWRDLARSMVVGRFGHDQHALAAFASRFDRAAIFNAKALIIVMVAVFAPIPALLFRRPHRAAGVHLVFALHLYSFVLMVLCAALAIAEAELLMGGAGLGSPQIDTWLTVANLLACTVYIYLSIGATYSASGLSRLVAAGILALGIGVILIGYRFAIFVLTFYTN